ncbi:MAG: hypothetical protein HC846_11635 [Blastocatellia bacterium]|nr:hypothetical protein [Blastocatellia bacterium]
MITRAVEKGQTVIILDNVGLGNNHGKITNSIISILNGQPAEPPKKSIAETLYKIITEKMSPRLLPNTESSRRQILRFTIFRKAN